jgi:hypothetical protein
VARQWTYLQQLDGLEKPIVARGQRLLAVEKVLVEVESTLIAAEKKQDALEKEFDSIEKWAVAQKGYTPPSGVGRRK